MVISGNLTFCMLEFRGLSYSVAGQGVVKPCISTPLYNALSLRAVDPNYRTSLHRG